MPVSEGFRTFVIEQLEQTTRDIHARAMFGGVGIYAGDSFFALIANDILYFKVDDQTRPQYTALGMKPFRPYGEDGEVADAIAVAQRATPGTQRGRSRR